MVEPFSYAGQPPIIWAARHDPMLIPIPWKCLIDPFTGWLYFWNPVTNVTQYPRPSAPLYHQHHQFYLERSQHYPYPWLPPHYGCSQLIGYPNQYPWLPTLHAPICYSLPSIATVVFMPNYPQHLSFTAEEGEDRISELPDDLISHILSFLPTLSAFRTTVLSRRWNKMWTLVRHLDFDVNRDKFRHEFYFEIFVQHVLQHMSSLHIGKFRLRYATSHTSSFLEHWVSAAVSLNVVELDLQVLFVPDRYYLVALPSSIFCCKTLKVLKLWIGEGIYIPQPPTTSAGCFFPSLKIFHLTVVSPDQTLGRLLSSFPVLEDLSIHVQVIDPEEINARVFAPELKTLKLSMESSEANYYDEISKSYRFCVDAPKLENLDVLQSPMSSYMFKNPESVVNATIAFEALVEEDKWRPPFPDSAYQLLIGMSNVKCLSLSDQPIKASHLPVLGNLNQLRLVLSDHNGWEFLTVLQKTPNLEHLDLVLEDGTVKDDPELQWNPPELVPDCLSSNLKTISVRRFKGLEAETKLAKYVLLNGCHLSKMTIHTSVLEKEEACKDLMTFPRAMTCQVEFKGM